MQVPGVVGKKSGLPIGPSESKWVCIPNNVECRFHDLSPKRKPLELPGGVDTHPTLPSCPIHLIGFSWVVSNSTRCCFTFKKKHRFLQRPNGVSAGSSESSFLLQFLGCFFRDKSSLNLEVGVLRCEQYPVSMAFCTVPICLNYPLVAAIHFKPYPRVLPET